ncbi:MAG: response regulator, partial [Chthoniobacteraceae bacterium]|nr:response regulator [Chthoniobacteraceae bacterium]
MRILFVDDEFLLLESLQMMLRPICQNWQMEFVESGAEALALMETEPFDVIVSDLRMPKMGGVELLNEVMKRFPDTVRVLVCDPEEERLVDARTAVLHEFLFKPYAAEALKTTILRACGEDDSAGGGKLETLMAKISRVPSIPTLYMELIALMKNPDAGIDDVGAIIAKDMTMTAIVLKMANSAYFGLQRVVS